MFLNKGEKENKRRGGGENRDRTLDTCVKEKNKKKRKERKNNIKNKKS